MADNFPQTDLAKKAALYVHRMTLGSARVLMGLPPKTRQQCIRALAIIKQEADKQTKGNEHGEH